MNKQNLLNRSKEEIKELIKAKKDYYFYLGICEDKEIARVDKILLGQSWFAVDNLDYVPSQVIDNKIKPLISKQARFMFGQPPTLLLKPFNLEQREKCEKLRQFITSILNANKFWSNTLKAFRIATVSKKVLLRLEANPNSPIKIFYHSFDDFTYTLNEDDMTTLKEVTILKKVSENHYKKFRYYFVYNTCWVDEEEINGDNKVKISSHDTKLSKIPCWLITNEQDLYSPNGVSDIKDLIPLQNEVNAKMSDFSDALRFDMFTQTVITDATEKTVNKTRIAPNSLMALCSIEGKDTKAFKLESTFQNAEAVETYLKRLNTSLYEKLSIPLPEQLKNVPSAKTLKYIYSELVARCAEKWNDWEPAIRSMIRLIVEACTKFDCYKDWDSTWNDLFYSIVIKKKYPIPEDEDDARRLGMEEVRANVRSNRSYIRDFQDDEDVERIFKEICEDVTAITGAENEQFLGNDEDA